MYIDSDRYTNRHSDKHTNRHTNRHRDRHSDRHITDIIELATFTSNLYL